MRKKLKITCVSDLHGFLPPELPGGDLLIVAGDLTASDQKSQYGRFVDWFLAQDYRKKVFIAGNHDGMIQSVEYYFNHDWAGYLEDSGLEFEGLKLWGSPWTPEFCDWHFMASPEERRKKFALIPDNTDILITHGPPYGVLDECPSSLGGGKLRSVGCPHLRERLEQVKPRLHVFGHIHEGYGQMVLKHSGSDTLCVNAAIMDRNYNPTNKPVNLELSL